MATLARLSRRVCTFSSHFPSVKRSFSAPSAASATRKWRIDLGLLAAASSAVLVLLCNNNTVFATHKTPESDAEYQKAVKLNKREKRFIKFASVEYDGQLYMTPQDFLESVVGAEPKPRPERRALTKKELQLLVKDVPSLKKGNTHMFRNLQNKGIISYTEYLFLLSILTKPKTGFRIAFNMFDTDGNERVDKTEFLVIRRLLGGSMRKQELDDETKRALRAIIVSVDTYKMRRKLLEPESETHPIIVNADMEKIFSHTWRCRHDTETDESRQKLVERQNTPEEIQLLYIDDSKGLQKRHSVDTTLMIHFFGKDGKTELKYEDFKFFMENLQHEVLELEFLKYSEGRDFISEQDFAKMLLRYTYLEPHEYRSYLNRIINRAHLHLTISFDEFQRFYQFLNNLEDFTIAMRMYTLANQPISKDEFQRAVKICIGHPLSNHIIDTVFALFDDDGDGQLSYKEFIAIMKDRLQRNFKPNKTYPDFKKCVKKVIESTR